MSTPLHGQQTGTYTSDGNARVIELRFDPDYFTLMNATNFNLTPNPGVVKRAWWFRSLAANNAFTVRNTDAAATDQSEFLTTNGFRLVNTITDTIEAAQTGTALTNATPAVATLIAHGFVIGDTVRISNTTDMFQVAGMDFSVTAVADANTFTLGFLPAAGFADPAAAITARRLPFDPRDYAPKNRFVTAITQAASAVVTLSVTHGYAVGEIISFRVPEAFGMLEMDSLQGEITAVSTANNTVTVDIDSSSFTAFAFPTSAEAVLGVTFAQTVPVGDAGSVLTGAIRNTAFIGLNLGTAVVGANAEVVHWIATKGVVQV